MDYGQLIVRAWKIVWDNKWLLALSLLVILGRVIPQIFTSVADVASESADPLAFLIVLCCILPPIEIALVAVSVIADGALVAGVDQVEVLGVCRLLDAWQGAWRKGWRLAGIYLVTNLLMIVSIMVISVIYIVASGAALYMTGGVEGAPTDLFSVMFIVLPCAVILGWPVFFIFPLFVNRACVVENVRFFRSYWRGWEVLRKNFGRVLVLILIQGIISFVLLTMLVLPLLLFFGFMQVQPYWAGSACLIFLFALLALLADAVVRVWFSAQWTLAWHQWTGTVPIPELVEQAPAI